MKIVLLLLLSALSLPAQPVPLAYQDLYTQLSVNIAIFDAVVKSGWNGSAYPYLRAPHLLVADSSNYTSLLGVNYYQYAVEPALDEMQALGANAVTVTVDFPIFYQPFFSYVGSSQYPQFTAFYQRLAADVHARGMKFVIESSCSDPPVGNVVTFAAFMATFNWTQYQAARAADTVATLQALDVDYVTVMTESDTEEAISGQTALGTVTGVVQEVTTILSALTAAGSKIPVGGGVGTWTANYLQYVDALVALPISFLDIHIYPINQNGSNNYFALALQGAQAAAAAGKPSAISECWLYKIRNSELGNTAQAVIYGRDPFSFWAPLDTAFLWTVAELADYQHMLFVSPFWTEYLFAYLDYSTYGSLPDITVSADALGAAETANGTGAFTSTGLAYERMNVPADTSPPATPAAPTSGGVGYTTATVDWIAGSDNVGVSAYKLYRNGTLIATTTQLVYYDSGLSWSTSYSYTLAAVDASGNVSAMSPALVIKTHENSRLPMRNK